MLSRVGSVFRSSYQVSPLLREKVRRGISAGRVQTAAVSLMVEREREVQTFTKQALGVERPYALRSAAYFVGRLGAMTVAALLGAGRTTLDTLYEASADLGEWYIRRHTVDLEYSEPRSRLQ